MCGQLCIQRSPDVLCVCPSVRPSVCPLDFLQDGTESAAENWKISITREYLENDGLRSCRFSLCFLVTA